MVYLLGIGIIQIQQTDSGDYCAKIFNQWTYADSIEEVIDSIDYQVSIYNQLLSQEG